jgi:hypothetical protein
MTFWSDITLADPKRQHRWLVQISAPELAPMMSYVAKKINKPKMTIGEAEHKFLNHTFYYPGGVTYDPISITLVDSANPHSTKALYDLIQVSGYRLPNLIEQSDISPNQPDMSTISKRRGVNALESVIITQLDGEGNRVDETTLKNAWIKSVDFGGELSYESEGLMEVTMEIRFDYFQLECFTPELPDDIRATE